MEIQFHPGSGRGSVRTLAIPPRAERPLLAALAAALLLALSLAVTAPAVLLREGRREAARRAAVETGSLAASAEGVRADAERLATRARDAGELLTRIAFLYGVPPERWPRALDPAFAVAADGDPGALGAALTRSLEALELARRLLEASERRDPGLADRSPALLPVREGPVAQAAGFGPRVSPWTGEEEFFRGIDLAAPEGTPVVAPAAGVVRFVGRAPRAAGARFARLGTLVVVSHGRAGATLYGHLSRVDVRRGDSVRRLQRLGAVGRSGWALSPQLHYEVWRPDGGELRPIDPVCAVLDRRLDAPARSLAAMLATSAPGAAEWPPGLAPGDPARLSADIGGPAPDAPTGARSHPPSGRPR